MLLPRYGTKIVLLKRFIDDMCGIVLVGGDDGFSANEWTAFKRDIDRSGLLRWDVDEPSKSIDFLDLTIKIDGGGSITTQTYQKPINLYQYIMPNSAHPPGMIRGVIYSLLRTYFLQNSEREDYLKYAILLYKRLKARGWARAVLEPIFVAAHDRICSQPQRREKRKSKEPISREQIVLHLEFHPDDIPRKRVRELYAENCEEVFRRTLGIERAIVAYSRPRNLRDLLQSAKLREKEGSEVRGLTPCPTLSAPVF